MKPITYFIIKFSSNGTQSCFEKLEGGETKSDKLRKQKKKEVTKTYSEEEWTLIHTKSKF